MKVWLLSITAVALLLVLLELIMSEGQTKKYIKGFVNLSLIIVIVFPIVSFVSSGTISVDAIFDNGSETQQTEPDNSFLNAIYLARYQKTERDIQNALKEEGIFQCVASITVYYTGSGTVGVQNIVIDVSNAVITDSDKNIIANDKIREVVKRFLEIKEENILIHGEIRSEE